MRLLILAIVAWGSAVVGIALSFTHHPAKDIGVVLCSMLPIISLIEVVASYSKTKYLKWVRWIYWKLEGKVWYLKRISGGYPLLAYPLSVWITFTGGKIFIDQGKAAFIKGSIDELDRCSSGLQKAMEEAVEDAKSRVIRKYMRIMDATLGQRAVTERHLRELWDIGFLPLQIKALPEGEQMRPR